MTQPVDLDALQVLYDCLGTAPWSSFGKQVIDGNQTIILQSNSEYIAAYVSVVHAALPALLDEIRELRQLLTETAMAEPRDVVVGSMYSSDAECFYCGCEPGFGAKSELGWHEPNCWYVRARAALGGSRPAEETNHAK